MTFSFFGKNFFLHKWIDNGEKIHKLMDNQFLPHSPQYIKIITVL